MPTIQMLCAAALLLLVPACAPGGSTAESVTTGPASSVTTVPAPLPGPTTPGTTTETSTSSANGTTAPPSGGDTASDDGESASEPALTEATPDAAGPMAPPAATPTSTVPPSCGAAPLDDGNPCTFDRCLEGRVRHLARANGTSCNDGNPCTQQDRCMAGACRGDPAFSDNCAAPDDPVTPDDPPEPDSPPEPDDLPPDPPAPPVTSALSGVWANEGGEKIPQEEVRATSDPAHTISRLWDGATIHLFGARNEVVQFNLLLEAATADVTNVAVQFDTLHGPNGAQLQALPVNGLDVFTWTQRPIELFYVRYLPIRGLSLLGYSATYDERHVPDAFRRPWSGDGEAEVGTTWFDRPHHDLHYPDIAVPLEWVDAFDIAAGTHQAIWCDLYIPKTTPSGLYTGEVNILEHGTLTRSIPVQLQVRSFTLPDQPSAKTMIVLGYGDINDRYLGVRFPDPGPLATAAMAIRDRHFLVAHRHKLSLIDANDGPEVWGDDSPRPAWIPRLDGSLFTPAAGYAGPGVGIGNGVFSIGTYQAWYTSDWDSEAEMRVHSNNWVNWFAQHAPTTEYFLYLIDESMNFAQIETWAQWIENNPGPGQQLPSLATLNLPAAYQYTPTLDIPTATLSVGITEQWETAAGYFQNDPTKRVYLYNGRRPASGTLMTEDDGVALRVTAWAQYKQRIDRWFMWESAYYTDTQTCGESVNLFREARTFGCDTTFDEIYGRTGALYANGDGVLFYPGTDRRYPEDSYEMAGPIASLRLKLWRRGIQDVDYLTMAAAKDANAVDAIVQQMIPKVLWEYGVNDPNDPSHINTDVSWSRNPDDWETAREQLADIIESK